MKFSFMFYISGGVHEEFFTTEDTELHGGIKDFRTKTPWYSVVNSSFLDSSKAEGIV